MDLVNEELKIEEILENTKLTPAEKNESILKVKSFVIKDRGNSSIKTIFSCANTMIGSVCLLLPMIFANSGIFTCLIILIVVCLISVKTCDLLLIHVREEELDLPSLIDRLLGKFYSKLYCASSGLLLIFVTIIYFLLMTSMMYLIIQFFVHDTAPQDQIDFSRYSYQYASIITLGIAFILVNLKKIGFIVKLGHYGVICLYIYTVFIIYIGIDNIVNGNFSEKKSEINYVSSDIANLAGTFALSYMLHNAVIPIVKQNKDQNKNSRDIKIAFGLTSIIYCIIGVFGCLGLVGKDTPNGAQANTVMDYFDKDDVKPFIIEIIFVSHLLTSFPIVCYLARTQCLQLFFHYERIPAKYSFMFNVFICLICLLCGIFNISPGIIMAIDGALVGFFIIYVVPIKLHLKCLYEKNLDSEVDGNSNQGSNNLYFDSQNLYHKDIDSEKTVEPIYNDNIQTSLIIRDNCKHTHHHSKYSKTSRYIFYGIIMIIGIAFMVIQIEEFIRSKTK